MTTAHTFDPNELNLSPAGFMLVKNVADELHKQYEGWAWAITLDERPTGGIMVIYNLDLTGDYGHVFKIGQLTNYDDIKRDVMRAGGAMLERFGMPRRARRQGDTFDIKRDQLGRKVFEK